MDGWETARAIRQCCAAHDGIQPSIILISSLGRDTLLNRTPRELELVNGFLVRPVTSSMLLDAVIDPLHAKAHSRHIEKLQTGERRLDKLRLLVVEDNLINQQVAEELLAAEGALVTLAANGQLGVAAVAAARQPFDAVLMDIQMPVMDGYAATREIRDVLGLKTLPIIAMTANALESDRLECLAAGMDAHVGKPFDVVHLVEVIGRLTGGPRSGLASPSPG
jgi:CheY-like chemotaxis protein